MKNEFAPFQKHDKYSGDFVADEKLKQEEERRIKMEEKEKDKAVASAVGVNELPQVAPRIVIKYASEAAKNLTEIIARKERKVIIGGKHYLEFADWQTLGKFFKMGVKTHEAMPITIEGITGAKARADVVNLETGLIIGGAEAYCLKDEPNWRDKPFFQLASMAQTRAAAKALRNELGWVAVLGGFADTPAEEMVNGTITKQKPKDTEPQGTIGETINFGKYKGQTLEEIYEVNSQYFDWLLKQDWFNEPKWSELKDKVQTFLDKQRFPDTPPEDAGEPEPEDDGVN